MSSGSGNVSNVVQMGGGGITTTIASGGVPQITIPITNLSAMVTLVGSNSSPSSSDYYGFYSASSPGSQTQYQVPAGKTFYVLGFYFGSGSSGNGGSLQLGYSTAALASEGTSTAPTGAIYYGASSTITTSPLISTVNGPAYTYFPVGMSFPAGDYPFWRATGVTSANIIIIGIVQ